MHQPRCGERLELVALPGLPLFGPGDDLCAATLRGLAAAGQTLRDADVIVVSSKAISRCEGRFVDLTTVAPSERAQGIARETEKDPRVVELILREATSISRSAPGVLVVRHRLGFVSANAGIDMSNAAPLEAAPGSGPWVLLLPVAPDASARRLRDGLRAATQVEVGVIVTDSFGRPFRLGTVGAAIGVAGMPPLADLRGDADLFGRQLEHTVTAFADQVAAAADLVAGQAAERRAVVVVRGLSFPASDAGAGALERAPAQDLYA